MLEARVLMIIYTDYVDHQTTRSVGAQRPQDDVGATGMLVMVYRARTIPDGARCDVVQ